MTLEVPIVVSGNVSFVGSNTSGVCPVPKVLISCGLVVASSVSSIVPFSLPAASGVKVTVTLQLAFTASVLPHVFVAEYCGTVGRMLVMFSVEVPLLVMVRVLEDVVVPMGTLPK